jgi:hypothetical protein
MEVLTALNTPVQGWRFDGRHDGAGPGLKAATDIAPCAVVSERRGQNSTCNAIDFRIRFRKRPKGICQRCGVHKKGPFLPIAAV